MKSETGGKKTTNPSVSATWELIIIKICLKSIEKATNIKIKRVDFNWSNLIFSIRRTESPQIIESKKTSVMSVKP